MKRLASLSALAATAFAHTLFGLDNEGIVKMHKAGLDEETIMMKMEQEPAEYDLSTDGLIELKKAGLSESVIQLALSLKNGGKPSSDAADSRKKNRKSGPPAPSVMQDEATPETGEIYFTRHTFYQEKGKHVATNYSRGRVVPINTEVEFIGETEKGFNLRVVDTGEVIKIFNEPKYTNESNISLAGRYLANSPTPIEKLPEDMAVAIETGTLRLGMTKEQALLARGYPPVHETASTKLDRWVYWSSRFVKLTILFRDDRIAEGRGLY